MRLYPPVPDDERQAVAEVRWASGSSRPALRSSCRSTRSTGTRVAGAIPTRSTHALRAGQGGRDPALPVHAVRGGPRICIGRSFALVEATAILATLVRHARFELAGG
jgi:hypothetical protein